MGHVSGCEGAVIRSGSRRFRTAPPRGIFCAAWIEVSLYGPSQTNAPPFLWSEIMHAAYGRWSNLKPRHHIKHHKCRHPMSSALSAGWDRPPVSKIGRAAGREGVERQEVGVAVVRRE